MSTPTAPLLVQALREPLAAARWSPAQWSEAVRQARTTGLLGRLAERLPPQILVPPGAQGHLEAARRLGQAQRAEVLREARHLDAALRELPAPVVLLKGAAYAVAALPAAAGRVYGDIDVLVPRAHLDRAEALLLRHGWLSTEPSDYNQRYYRRWMHELPPMQHIHRGTTLDVHHALVPPTSRLRTPAAPLFDVAVPLPGLHVLHRLSPPDMLLHAMVHLVLNDDVTHALRDLSDLDVLWRHFAAADGGPDGAVPLADRVHARARELGLLRPLYHALEQLARIWATPGLAAGPGTRIDAPGPAAAAAMAAIWQQVLQPPRSSPARRLAEAALWVRGHWLRMPMRLLLPHLAVKASGLHQTNQTRGRVADANVPR